MISALPVLLLALLLQAAAPETAEGPRGSIAGVCLSVQTGEPVKSASVLLSGNIGGRPSSQAALTRADGAFSFERLQAGAYSLNVEKTGYQQVSAARPITLGENQSRTGLEIKLNRAAVIAGRVTDPEAAPIIGAEVGAYRFVWLNGRRTAVRSNVVRTDDRGVYRLFGLPEGRYVIAASAPLEQQPAGEADLSLTRAFYPTGT